MDVPLKYWGIGYYEGWMHDEGTLVHVCRYPEPDKTDWKHWLAATSDRLVPFQRKGGFDIAEENFLPWNMVFDMALQYHRHPGPHPVNPGVFWH